MARKISEKTYPARSKSAMVLRLVFEKMKAKLIERSKEDVEEVDNKLKVSKSFVSIR